MKTFNKIFPILLSVLTIATLFSACTKDNKPTATINVLAANNNKSGDVKGDGGSVTRTWKFTNPNSTSGWDMSIDATTGSFQLVLKDAAGTVLLDKTLTAGIGNQAADGTTPAGTSGEWTAIATLTNFNGSGDYSFR